MNAAQGKIKACFLLAALLACAGEPGQPGPPGPSGAPGEPGSQAQLAPRPSSNDLFATAMGATGDGKTDDTAALVAMFSEMQRTGKPGLLTQGRYLTDCGKLEWTFTNAGDNVAGPTLLTSGKVVLVAKEGTANAPFINIHNDGNKGGRFVMEDALGLWSLRIRPKMSRRDDTESICMGLRASTSV
jgi:hypothetical protein